MTYDAIYYFISIAEKQPINLIKIINKTGIIRLDFAKLPHKQDSLFV